jgi:preprotein translocase subunit SecD
VAEPVIQQQGTERILVQLPGVQDPERVKEILGDPATLDWKEVSFPPGAGPNWIPPTSEEQLIAQFGGRLPDDTEIIPEDRSAITGKVTRIYWPLKRVSVVVGDDLRDARRDTNQWNESVVAFELTQDAGRRFFEATTRNVDKPMAIVLGGKEGRFVLSAPNIDEPIRDQGIIRGGFSLEEADDFALKLRTGAFPADVRFMEERVVGPSLGRDSIRAGLISGLSGFAGVLLFMLIYYRLSGVNAVVALGLNILLVFGALGALPFMFQGGGTATLTLPGIAGLILTVGMAVDSNVLIFERIREELRVGKTVRSAVEQGFARAFRTILDCNVTTLVAAFFLFSYGTGPVQGFAVTLTIGLLASMFTAVFVSRQIFELVLTRKSRSDSLSI